MLHHSIPHFPHSKNEKDYRTKSGGGLNDYPQILTETYSVLRRNKGIVIDEIEILTTVFGKQILIKSLLAPGGHFHKMLNDYTIAENEVLFDAGQIVVLKDSEEQPLGDIRSTKDNEHIRKQIFERVEYLTADPDVTLHCSLAGGRKSMGFLFGAAMQFFGREQDRLYHVLVSPLEIEAGSTFYYRRPENEPVLFEKRNSDVVKVKENGVEREIYNHDVKVDLAEINFCRLRNVLQFVRTQSGNYTDDTLRVTQYAIDNYERMIKKLSESKKEGRKKCLNLVFSASESLAIGGVKQSTHPPENGYCTENWYDIMQGQLSQLISDTKKVIEQAPDLSHVKNYLKLIQDFQREMVQLGDGHPNTISKSNEFMRKFRYGTSLRSSRLLIDNQAPERLCDIGFEFEIYVPVHEIFQTQFRRLIIECDTFQCYAHGTIEKMDLPGTWSKDKTPEVYNDYLIFGRQGDGSFWSRNAYSNLLSYFEAFRNAHFDLFGKMYFWYRHTKGIRLFDCTEYPSDEKSLDTFADKTLVDRLTKQQKAMAFFIFEFEGWRQK